MNSKQDFETVLITGASSGIGLELAKIYAGDGYRLILVAQDKRKLAAVTTLLKNTGSPSITSISLDLSLPLAAEALYKKVNSTPTKVDVLINNAGFGWRGEFIKSDMELMTAMMTLNIMTLTKLCRFFGGDMVTRKSGQIVNIASVAAYFPGPLMAVYYASKAYVLSFSESLTGELEGSGVTVTCVCPGPTQTDFQKRAGAESAKLFQLPMTSAEAVARDAYSGIRQGKRVVVTGFLNKLEILAKPFIPTAILVKAIKELHR